MTTSPYTLRATNVKKAFFYPKKISILNGINLEVPKSTSVAIIGRSGEGKSTLLQILGTLDEPTEGTLEISGISVNSRNKCTIRNQEIGFIFQSFHLLDDYTALENVLMPAYIARKNISKDSEAYQLGLKLLDYVGLSDRAHHHTKLLSGGEKQRVAIARALCNNPNLLLADEPSGNLDAATAQMIHNLLLQYVKENNKSLILVTHDQNLANRCDQVYTLKSGQLVY